MTTFVLVPGFWLGGWAWDRTAQALREKGHAAHALTLTGLDGSAAGAVGVATHIADVVGAIDRAAADGGPVVLVGHSGGGPVAAAAADQRPGVLAHLVYVDTAALPDGWAQIDFHPAEAAAVLRAGLAATAAWPLPSDQELEASGSSRAGIDEADWAAVRARAGAQPSATVLDPIPRGAREADLPKTVVACSFPPEAVAAMAVRFPELADPEWTVRALPTGHWPMFSRPVDLAAVLADLPLRAGPR